MKCRKEKSTMFEYMSRKKVKRGKYLKYKDVKCSEIKTPTATHICIDCRERIPEGNKAHHITKYNTELFSAFMCDPCFQIFKNNEVEI